MTQIRRRPSSLPSAPSSLFIRVICEIREICGLYLSSAAGIVGGLGLLLTLANGAGAAPPDVTSLFPAGARCGMSASVTIQGKPGDGVGHVWCSQPGVTVTLPEKPGPITVHVAPQVEPGVCWLRFFNDDGASALRPFVIGTCIEINEVEPNDDVEKAQPLELPVVVNGQHGKSGDADSFAVPLRKGQVLVASLMANRILGSPQDAVLQILGPNGFVLEQNEDDQGFDPQLAFTAPADGIYVLRTWAFPMTPDSSIRLFGSPACVYRLTVTTGPFVDHILPAAVQAGLPQKVRLHGWNLPDVEIDIAPPVSAMARRYEWPLEGWAHRLPATVLVQPHVSVVEQEPNDLSKPQVLTLPVSVTGQIDQPRDVDAYQFTAKKGQRLRFEIIARDAGSPLDPVLRLYDSTGKVLREADDDGKQSADPDIEFTAPADGDYRATVTDRFLLHGERFAYLMSITEPQPDFSLSVATDAFALLAGNELEVPVTITRTSGFAEEIRIQITGLPTGVTADPAMSESKGDSAKTVKLKLKSDGQAASSGPIHILGRPGVSSSLEKSATASLKAFQTDTPHIWLTVKK